MITTENHSDMQMFRHILLMLLMPLVISACSNYEYHVTTKKSIDQIEVKEGGVVSNASLLDVAIEVFDPGVDLLQEELLVFENLRKSEAVWFAGQLKQALETSKAWGVVRAMPENNQVMDLLIRGKILVSNGEELHLNIKAIDASGVQWFSKDYAQRASVYAYNPETRTKDDAFRNLFVDIANDLTTYRKGLAESEALTIRHIARMRFAKEFAPDFFQQFVNETETGKYQLLRLPADNDPMLARIEKIHARNDLFLDVVQDYYRAFNRNMHSPYHEWRMMSYKQVRYERQLREQSKREKIAGVVAMAGGLAAGMNTKSGTSQVARYVSVISGARIFALGYTKADAANAHLERIRELGESLELELEPNVIDLQERTVTLSGTVQDQYREWRNILHEMYQIENQEVMPALPREAKAGDERAGLLAD